jgi:hypothetical protein
LSIYHYYYYYYYYYVVVVVVDVVTYDNFLSFYLKYIIIILKE